MSSQPLSLREEDYETIHAAVMETARGRWFLNEYAYRNRAADTQIVLDAIAALEKKFETAPKPDQTSTPDDGQAKRQILAAAEDVQEASWALRELGANPVFCARLDRNAVDISAACSPDIDQEDSSDTGILEKDIIDEESDAPLPFISSKNLSAASTLIEAQSAGLPKSSLPQMQAVLVTAWPEEDEEEIAAAAIRAAPAFSLADYCFEEKIALFS
jgi:hypothetical protein